MGEGKGEGYCREAAKESLSPSPQPSPIEGEGVESGVTDEHQHRNDMSDKQKRFGSTCEEYYFEAEGCWISEWWNTPEDEAVSVARARVEPGVTTHWHRLRGIAERYVILEGEGRAEIGDAPPRDVGPGDVVAIAPDVPQRVANTGAGDLVFLAVCTPRFRPDAYENVD